MKRIVKFIVRDSSIAGEIRRTISSWAQEGKFDDQTIAKMAIVINELSTNILKHATSGEIICFQDSYGIDILAIDNGPGMKNVLDCLQDGFSTRGTAGNGLGAIRRLSHQFDLFTQENKGTVLYAHFGDIPEYEIAGLSVPIKGERLCGDGWAFKNEELSTKILVSDGLGHGHLAHEATTMALNAFKENENLNSLAEVNAIHTALRSTRGAAIAVADIKKNNFTVDYTGLGNIVATIYSPSSVKRLISYNGIAGVQMRKIQMMTYPIGPDSLLIMHSDGVSTHWNLSDYSGLFYKHPFVIAGVLYRDYSRNNDDTTVLVMRMKK